MNDRFCFGERVQRLYRLGKVGRVRHDVAVAENHRPAGVAGHILIVRHKNGRRVQFIVQRGGSVRLVVRSPITSSFERAIAPARKSTKAVAMATQGHAFEGWR